MRSALGTNIGGIATGEEAVKDLRYADDTTAISETVREMKHMIEKIRLESEKIGLYLKVDKSKMMVIEGNNEQLHVNCRVVEKVTDFNFLGPYITEKGSSRKEIDRRIAMAKSATISLTLILKDRSVTKTTKFA